jgi:hypothetical protein
MDARKMEDSSRLDQGHLAVNVDKKEIVAIEVTDERE